MKRLKWLIDKRLIRKHDWSRTFLSGHTHAPAALRDAAVVLMCMEAKSNVWALQGIRGFLQSLWNHPLARAGIFHWVKLESCSLSLQSVFLKVLDTCCGSSAEKETDSL
ncbi:hypothetical protein G5714_009902 [Onychostoma macrolepis]|uniref:Uncharacterized protein n=1 Tax=Onychostoma macrolepis TaxID=369639 RepID=A0A7J6CNC3_9TELE|nr:hypothetical protein G5714_009902 [Onychostoma macrolepis]